MIYYQKENIIQILSQIMYGKLPSSKAALPPHVVLSTISIFIITLIIMNTKLLSPEPDPSIEEEEDRNDTKAKDIEQEIECSRCYDVMTLSSNFDNIGYVCNECDFLLVMK
jgi:hypothetical protein